MCYFVSCFLHLITLGYSLMVRVEGKRLRKNNFTMLNIKIWTNVHPSIWPVLYGISSNPKLSWQEGFACRKNEY